MDFSLVTLPCQNLSNHMHHGTQQGGRKVMISSWIGFNHGQILIETATHSWDHYSQEHEPGIFAEPFLIWFS